MIAAALDVARSGEDETVLAVRNDMNLYPLVVWSLADTMVTVGRVIQVVRTMKIERIVIDINGIGAGVYDRLREQEYPVIPFHGSAKTDEKDASGMLSFVNMRAYAWWTFRDKLDPRIGRKVGLPEDDMLIGDLCAPKYKPNSRGDIQIEDKDQVKKRLGRSPDRGDAVVMCYYDGGVADYEESYTLYTPEQVLAMIQYEIETERQKVIASGKPDPHLRPEPTVEQIERKVEEEMWKGADQVFREDDYVLRMAGF